MTQKEDKSYKNLMDFWKNIEAKNSKSEKSSTEQTTGKKQESKTIKDVKLNILNKNESVRKTVKNEDKGKVFVVGQETTTKDKKLTSVVTEKPKHVVAEVDKKPTTVYKSKSVPNKREVLEEKSKVLPPKIESPPTKEIKATKETQKNTHPFVKTQAPKEETPKEKPLKEVKKVLKERTHTEKTTSTGDKKNETLKAEPLNEEKTKTHKEKPKKETPIDAKENKPKVEAAQKNVEIKKTPLLNEVMEQINESKKILNACKETLKECKEEYKKTEEEIQKDMENLQTKIFGAEEIPPKQVEPPKDTTKFRKRRVTIIDPDIIKRALETTDDKETKQQPKTIEIPKEETRVSKQDLGAPKEEAPVSKQEVDTTKETSRRSRQNRMSVINIKDLQMRQSKVDESKKEETLLTKEKELFDENSRLESISLSDLKKETAPKPRARDRRMSVIDLARMYSNKSDDEDL